MFFKEGKRMIWSKRIDLEVLNSIIMLFKCFNNGVTQYSVNLHYNCHYNVIIQ